MLTWRNYHLSGSAVKLFSRICNPGPFSNRLSHSLFSPHWLDMCGRDCFKNSKDKRAAAIVPSWKYVWGTKRKRKRNLYKDETTIETQSVVSWNKRGVQCPLSSCATLIVLKDSCVCVSMFIETDGSSHYILTYAFRGQRPVILSHLHLCQTHK